MTGVARILASLGLALGVLAGLALLAAGPGYRFGLWPLGTGFAILRYAAYGGIAGAAVAAVGFALAVAGRQRRAIWQALAGLLIGLIVVGVPWSYVRAAHALPPIHDITTDPDNPPAFDEATLSLRAGAANPTTYGGQDVADQQRQAYPDIRPLVINVPTDRAFDLALDAARAEGWRIVATEPQRRRIEASDQTFWFGFIDDIAVRISPQPTGSRIDVRSVSRVGRSDIGTNAARIRAYLDQIRAEHSVVGR
jgi:uncharacterized protein (DUF1499 family)